MDSQTNYTFADKLSVNEIGSDQVTHASADTKLLVVVERQEFVRGCLTAWIKMFCQEFGMSGIADVTAPSSEVVLKRADVVVFHVNGATSAETWLEGQVAWLRANWRDVPIVAIIDPDKARPIAEIVTRFHLQGYLPTSSSMGVAAAVLRLIAVGGTYIPENRDGELLPIPAPQIPRTSEAARTAGLTPRECVVLELLERGMSNKIIAYRLSLSQSTVKAHVHNIISKLKVHNRTEAAVASHQLQPPSVT
jgi:DNA-binding NarL/FixJ family response regulator